MSCKLSWKACGRGCPRTSTAPHGARVGAEGSSLDSAQQVGTRPWKGADPRPAVDTEAQSQGRRVEMMKMMMLLWPEGRWSALQGLSKEDPVMPQGDLATQKVTWRGRRKGG